MTNPWRVNRARRAPWSAAFKCAVLLLLPGAWIIAACGQTGTPAGAFVGKGPSEAGSTAGAVKVEDYMIGPDDLLNVYILDVPELSRDYRVSTTGMVTLPLMAKPVDAAGLTLSQLSDQISDRLRAQGLVSDPHVTVSVDKSNLHTVAITGAVKQPQIYPVFSKTTLLDVLSQAGGLAPDAGNIALVYRGGIANRMLGPSDSADRLSQAQAGQTLNVDLKRLLESGDPSFNVNIYPGDRITVPRAGIVYVVGAVNKPGGFTMNASSRGMTVLQALALAQDTTTTAQRSRSLILRPDPQAPDGRKEIRVDLKSILQGKSSDQVLQADDILFVPDSSSKRALHRGIDSVVQVATGVAIYGRF